MTGEETRLFTTWQSWATDEYGDVHRARTAADATVVSRCLGLPEAHLMPAARTGASVGSARSAALCSTNLDEMLENLVAFGWRPLSIPADRPGEREPVARFLATASVHRNVVASRRRHRGGTPGLKGRALGVLWWLRNVPGALLHANSIRRAGYGWLADEDGWLVITPTEAVFTGDRHHLRVAVGDVAEICETSDLAMTGAVPEAHLRVAHPSLILALVHSLESTPAAL